MRVWVGDITTFFEDNPGAIMDLREWIEDNYEEELKVLAGREGEGEEEECYGCDIDHEVIKASKTWTDSERCIYNSFIIAATSQDFPVFMYNRRGEDVPAIECEQTYDFTTSIECEYHNVNGRVIISPRS